MPRTVRDVIVRAMRFVHILGVGEVPTSEEASEALVELNGLIEQANLDKLLPIYRTDVSVPLYAGKASYQIASGLPPPEVNAPRPVQILSALSRRNQVDLPVFLATKEDWDKLIQQKTVTTAGWELVVYYEPAFPNGVLQVYPVPQDALTTLQLTVLAKLATYATLNDPVTLPEGYETWLAYTVGARLAVQYGLPWTAQMDALRQEAEEAIMRNNLRPFPVASQEVSLLGGDPGGYHIYSDRVRGW